MKRSSFRRETLGVNDRRHKETNNKIKKRCLETSDRKHAKTNCKINLSVGGGEELGGSWIHYLF
jgi:hypothetical protein